MVKRISDKIYIFNILLCQNKKKKEFNTDAKCYVFVQFIYIIYYCTMYVANVFYRMAKYMYRNIAPVENPF